MKRLIKIILLTAVLMVIGLTSCGGAGNKTSPTLDVNLVYTQLWQTVQAGQTLTAQAVPPTETPIEEVLNTPTEKVTNTPLISNTPLVTSNVPTATPFVITSPQPTAQQTADNSLFVTDVNYPDGSQVAPSTKIVKTWRFKNLGPSTWDQDFTLVFGWPSTSAEPYWSSSKIHSVSFPAVILPGATMDISITLTTPDKIGDYAAWFRLQNDKGFNFGDPFAIAIKVVK